MSLDRLAREIRRKLPVNPVDQLKRKLDRAVKNEEYEEAVASFADALLSGANLFLEEFLPFQRKVARLGALNSLSQTLLKLTAPGVPDVYQGNELWDFSLVDPDNRRPVDYGLRNGLLADLKRMDPADARSVLEEDAWEDGRPKLYLTWKALELRRDMPELFERGEYVPLGTEGEMHDRLVAFAKGAKGAGFKVVIAGAGGAAHLPGMAAAMTPLPVFGVPVQSHALSGHDSLLSIVQMPAGIPVGTLAIGRAGAVNAALLAAAVLALTDEPLAERLDAWRARQTEAVAERPSEDAP